MSLHSNEHVARCGLGDHVMGYMRPVSFFNHGKKSEHQERKHFTENIACNNQFKEKYQK